MLYDAGKPNGKNTQETMPGMAGGQVNQGVQPGTRDPLQILVDKEGDKVVDVWKETYREAVQRMDGDLTPLLEVMDTHDLWKNLNALIFNHLGSINLKQLVDEQKLNKENIIKIVDIHKLTSNQEYTSS